MKKEDNIKNNCNGCIYFAKESAKTGIESSSVENLPFCRNPKLLLKDIYQRIMNKSECEYFATKSLQDET